MGYNTDFEGTLKFQYPLTAEQELFLRTILPGEAEDTDDHPEWIKPKGYNGYVQLVIADDNSGIEWDGGEKFYDAQDAVNTVIMTMQAKFPDFGLEGKLLARGDEIGDIWELAIENGIAVKRDIKTEGDCYECPDCNAKVWTSKAKRISQS